MANNYQYLYNKIAVSANLKETAVNTPQTLDSVYSLGSSSNVQLARRKQDNADEINGVEGATDVYYLGNTTSGKLVFPRAQAGHFGFVMSYALGLSSPAAYGGGYKHTITPTSDELLPYFTAAMQSGSTVYRNRYASCVMDKVSIGFKKDDWISLEADVVGTGLYASNMAVTKITQTGTITSLTLGTKVDGATAAIRLDAIHWIRARLSSGGEWKEIAYSAVSNADPAVVTITAFGGAPNVDYEVLYRLPDTGWITFPSVVTESPIRTSSVTVNIGGTWNGSTYAGGRAYACELEDINYSLDNGVKAQFCIGSGVADYATRIIRGTRSHTLTISRLMRDYIMQRLADTNETFGINIIATGAEFESGKNLSAQFVFPRCTVLGAEQGTTDNYNSESVKIAVLTDVTNNSVWCQVANKATKYAG